MFYRANLELLVCTNMASSYDPRAAVVRPMYEPPSPPCQLGTARGHWDMLDHHLSHRHWLLHFLHSKLIQGAVLLLLLLLLLLPLLPSSMAIPGSHRFEGGLTCHIGKPEIFV